MRRDMMFCRAAFSDHFAHLNPAGIFLAKRNQVIGLSCVPDTVSVSRMGIIVINRSHDDKDRLPVLQKDGMTRNLISRQE